MWFDQDKVCRLYRKLLALYPRAFREQLGESMAQTFIDCYNERRQQAAQWLFGFVCAMFIETAIGISKEYFLQAKPGETMHTFTTKLKPPALISLILVLPFMLLELVNRRTYHEGFPVVVFGLLWLLPIAFIVMLMPIVQTVRAGSSILAKPLTLVLRVALLVLVAWLWGGILIDQLPCFLGVPNCD
jgi:hypothetical protein